MIRLARLGPAVATATAVFAMPALACSSARPRAGAPLAAPSCAWPLEATAANDNRGTPDNAAAYWITPVPVQPRLRVTLSGRYPDSRYFSLQVYKPGGGQFTTNGVRSALTDYQIEPDPPTVNPWQHPADQAGPSTGRYTVTLQSPVTPGRANTLPLAPVGTTTGTGLLIYRVYLPAGGNFAQVPLPSVTFSREGVSKRLSDCPAKAATAPVAPTKSRPANTGGATAPAANIEFARPSPGSGSGAGGNADTGYLFAEVTPPANGEVVVVRGEAPTVSKGSHPSLWPAPGVDTRYWSNVYQPGHRRHPASREHPAGRPGGLRVPQRHTDRPRR